jgi:putative YphP/YqiW family bacilliredoxin
VATAGGAEAAVVHLRGRLSPGPPTSTSLALFQAGKPVFMLHRSEIGRRKPAEIAGILTEVL